MCRRMICILLALRECECGREIGGYIIVGGLHARKRMCLRVRKHASVQVKKKHLIWEQQLCALVYHESVSNPLHPLSTQWLFAFIETG